MKTMRWVHGAALFIAVGLTIAQAAAPRKDINPALLYLHAFTLFPDLNEEESRLLGQDNAGDVDDEERAMAKRFDSAPCIIEPHGSTACGVDRLKFPYPGRRSGLFTCNHSVVVPRA